LEAKSQQTKQFIWRVGGGEGKRNLLLDVIVSFTRIFTSRAFLWPVSYVMISTFVFDACLVRELHKGAAGLREGRETPEIIFRPYFQFT